MQASTPKQDEISRRMLLGTLAAAGIAGPAAGDLMGQQAPKLSVDVLRNASVILGQDFSQERLKILVAALQHNLDEFQRVRNFKVDDLTEPAPAFISTRQDLPQAESASSVSSGAPAVTGGK